LSARVSLLGSLDRASMEQHAAAAWAQVVPSRWSESFGNVAAEAMMRGTAVIASRIGGMAEYIRDGESGILVSPGSADALASALLTILENRTLAEELGRRGREAALAHLNADGWAEQFESAYHRAIHLHAEGAANS